MELPNKLYHYLCSQFHQKKRLKNEKAIDFWNHFDCVFNLGDLVQYFEKEYSEKSHPISQDSELSPLFYITHSPILFVT